MARRRTRDRAGSSLPSDVINPGQRTKRHVLDPVRTAHTTQGVFRPSNQWRTKEPAPGPHNPHTDVRQRALLLAKHLPWLPQYNFARG